MSGTIIYIFHSLCRCFMRVRSSFQILDQQHSIWLPSKQFTVSIAKVSTFWSARDHHLKIDNSGERRKSYEWPDIFMAFLIARVKLRLLRINKTDLFLKLCESDNPEPTQNVVIAAENRLEWMKLFCYWKRDQSRVTGLTYVKLVLIDYHFLPVHENPYLIKKKLNRNKFLPMGKSFKCQQQLLST